MIQPAKIFLDIETLGFFPTNKIVLIQCKVNNKKIKLFREWELGENRMLEDFASYVGIHDYPIYIIFNARYEVSMITGRVMTLDFYSDKKEELIDKIFSGKKICDIQQFDSGYFVKQCKFMLLHGIHKECWVSGADIPALYKDKQYDLIEEHGIEDIEMMHQYCKKNPDIFKRFTNALIRNRNRVYSPEHGKFNICVVGRCINLDKCRKEYQDKLRGK